MMKKYLYPPFSRMPCYFQWAGIFALFLYGGGQFFAPFVGGAAESVAALLGLVAVLVYGQGIRRTGALWLLLVVIVIQCLSWWLGYLHHPDWVTKNPQIDRLAKLFIFIGVAWWLGGSTKLTLWLWLLAALGYIASTFIHGNGWHEWLAGFQGHRAGFGVRNGQHGAMLFGVLLLGSLVFAPRFLSSGPWCALRRLLWILLVSFGTAGILIGQTRAVWLALTMSLLLAMAIWFCFTAKRYSQRRALYRLAVCVVLVAMTGLVCIWIFHDLLIARITKESQVIAQLVEGDIQNIPYSSIGIRVHSWVAAWQWILERPIVGWGEEGRSLVIQHTDWIPIYVKQNFGHLHNYFIEIWVAYGLLGILVIGALSAWIGLATWRAWKSGDMPDDMALFGVAFFLYWMIVNQFESYNSFWTGVFVHNIIVGGLVTHYWRLNSGGYKTD